MSDDTDAAYERRQPDLYWKNLQQLKAASVCMRLHRNRLGRRVRTVDALKAIASSGAIGAWVIWRDPPFLWGAIIAATQVTDALKGVFPSTRQHKSASDLTFALETLCIDAEEEWESIYRGAIAAETINKRRTCGPNEVLKTCVPG
jgi:hypothetical protein